MNNEIINGIFDTGLEAILPTSILHLCVPSKYRAGDLLFKTNDKPVFMFYVTDGEVVLERIGLQGETVILQRSHRGFIGEASLQSSNYHCDGKIVTSSSVIAIPIDIIRTSLDTDPLFGSRWIAMLNREVKRLRQQCERLALPKLQSRVIHLIETEGTGGRYTLLAGVNSLARELGVTHEALYRCLANMEEKKLLVRENKTLSLVL